MPHDRNGNIVEVNAAIDALAEKALRGVLGISGHSWNARADIKAQAELLKRALTADKDTNRHPQCDLCGYVDTSRELPPIKGHQSADAVGQ